MWPNKNPIRGYLCAKNASFINFCIHTTTTTTTMKIVAIHSKHQTIIIMEFYFFIIFIRIFIFKIFFFLAFQSISFWIYLSDDRQRFCWIFSFSFIHSYIQFDSKWSKKLQIIIIIYRPPPNYNNICACVCVVFNRYECIYFLIHIVDIF